MKPKLVGDREPEPKLVGDLEPEPEPKLSLKTFSAVSLKGARREKS